MISRIHGLVLSLLLGVAAAAGAYATISTAHIGSAQTKPEIVSSRQIAARSHKLDAWEVSLREALAAEPPPLPALNRYAAAMFVHGPAPAALAAPKSPPRRAAQPSLEPISATVRNRPAPASTAKTDGPDHSLGVVEQIVVTEPEHAASAPTREPVAVIPEPKPAVEPEHAPEQHETTTSSALSPPPAAQALSVEQQCRQLLRATENKSESIKQAAEQQCEALKDAAEKKD